MSVHLHEFPPEILIIIFSSLHFTDLFSLEQTCRTLSKVIRSSTQLSYQSELQIAGMQDNPHCALPITTRLEMLRARERAWSSFDYQFQSNIKIPHKSSGLYDVTPGVYLMGKQDEDETTRSIQAVRPPYQADAPSEWEIIQFDADVIDFGTSIEENDLVASVCLAPIQDIPDMFRLCIILRRYSTHALYDGIASPIIVLSEVPNTVEHPVISIEISGENMAVVLMGMEEEDRDAVLIVFNWKTGTRADKLNLIPVPNPGLVFLREDILLNPQQDTNSLHIYQIPRSSEEVRFVHELLLPPLNDGFRISFIQCRGDPSPTANGLFPKNTSPSRPFANNPEDAIIIFALQIRREVDYEDDDDSPEPVEARHYVLVVHRKALLDLLPPDFPTAPPDAGIPWEVWGPPITRWIKVEARSIDFITLSAGQRFVDFRCHHGRDESERPDKIHIVDFNPWHVKLAQAHGTSSTKGAFIELNENRAAYGKPDTAIMTTADKHDVEPEHPSNVCDRGSAFVSDIVSRLPYILCTSNDRWKAYRSVLMDEERLIGTKLKDDDEFQLDSVDLLYFG